MLPITNNYTTSDVIMNALATSDSDNNYLSEMQSIPSSTPQIDPYINQINNSGNNLNLNYPTYQQKTDNFININNKLSVMSEEIVQLKDIIKYWYIYNIIFYVFIFYTSTYLYFFVFTFSSKRNDLWHESDYETDIRFDKSFY